MRRRTVCAKLATLVAMSASACSTEQFCPAEPIACSTDCGDAGTSDPAACLSFDEVAALPAGRAHGIHILTTKVEPAMLGFVTATADDLRASCREGTCYLYSGASVDLYAVPETQTRFTGWSGCSASTDPHLTVTAAHSDIACVAHFMPAFPPH